MADLSRRGRAHGGLGLGIYVGRLALFSSGFLSNSRAAFVTGRKSSVDELLELASDLSPICRSRMARDTIVSQFDPNRSLVDVCYRELQWYVRVRYGGKRGIGESPPVLRVGRPRACADS